MLNVESNLPKKAIMKSVDHGTGTTAELQSVGTYNPYKIKDYQKLKDQIS